MPANTFKAGDRVTCIDTDAARNLLVLGAVYTVTEAHDDDQGVVLAEGTDGRTWMNSRFEAAPAEIAAEEGAE